MFIQRTWGNFPYPQWPQVRWIFFIFFLYQLEAHIGDFYGNEMSGDRDLPWILWYRLIGVRMMYMLNCQRVWISNSRIFLRWRLPWNLEDKLSMVQRLQPYYHTMFGGWTSRYTIYQPLWGENQGCRVLTNQVITTGYVHFAPRLVVGWHGRFINCWEKTQMWGRSKAWVSHMLWLLCGWHQMSQLRTGRKYVYGSSPPGRDASQWHQGGDGYCKFSELQNSGRLLKLLLIPVGWWLYH